MNAFNKKNLHSMSTHNLRLLFGFCREEAEKHCSREDFMERAENFAGLVMRHHGWSEPQALTLFAIEQFLFRVEPSKTPISEAGFESIRRVGSGNGMGRTVSAPEPPVNERVLILQALIK